MIPGSEALARLQEGNRRFVAGVQDITGLMTRMRRSYRFDGQEPIAAVLGCADSRVPVESIFDQGLGDLFVVRVAGNIAADSQVGSLEFAVEVLRTRLVVVLGHSGCGAVAAAMVHRECGERRADSVIAGLLEHIRPSLEGLRGRAVEPGPGDLQSRAVVANVRHSIKQIRERSNVIRRLVDSGDLRLIGAVYELETGIVDFLG